LSTTEPTDAPRVFRLTLEYDGTDFAGFQIQGKGERTVQGVLEATIARLSGEPCRVHGAGRTDAGVHASGQIAHFASRWAIPPDKLAIALNVALPRDLVVKEAGEAEAGFHARYSATGRVYRYTILNREAPSALLGRYALHVRDPLDLTAMRAAAAELTGTHDFGAFGQPDAPGKSTVRFVRNVEVRPWKDSVLITVSGNAFLRQMVRAFVGTLLMAGKGRLTADAVHGIRESRDRANCPKIAPPHGLCLVRVEYDGTRYGDPDFQGGPRASAADLAAEDDNE
jgi:tRNA pseudouridine38-40 synthase